MAEETTTQVYPDSSLVNLATTNYSSVTDYDENTTVCTNEYCVSDDEYLDMILDFLFPEKFEWCLFAAYAIVFIVGLVGNFMVCFAVWRNKSMRTVTNYFIVNLAVADFLVVLICLPPTVLEDIGETWFMGRVGCKIVKYLQVSHGPAMNRIHEILENANIVITILKMLPKFNIHPRIFQVSEKK